MTTVEGRELLGLPPAEVWRRLNDPSSLAAAIPGCSALDPQPDGSFLATMTIAVGAVRGSYDGTLRYEEVEAPDRCTIAIAGRGKLGEIAGRGRLELVAVADGTEVAYAGSFEVRGRVAAVGGRVIGGVARRVIVETLRNLARGKDAA